MTTGLALTIGLNSLDPKHYHGWAGELSACEADAKDMADVASSQGFKVTNLKTKEATRSRVIEEINRAAKLLESGDIFMLSYSGHGSVLPDFNGDEPDDQDETWCMFDGELVDDELNLLLSEFARGVRILTFSDSCHSGTVTKGVYYQPKLDMLNSNVGSNGVKYKFVPTNIAFQTYRDNKDFYNKILKNPTLNDSEDKVKASVLLISGCQDSQLSADGIFNSLFTSQLLKVWKEGTFKQRYRKFHEAILNRMPPEQTPGYFITGERDVQFERQRPFTI